MRQTIACAINGTAYGSATSPSLAVGTFMMKLNLFAAATICAALLSHPAECRADLINYSYTGFVSSTLIPDPFPLNSGVTVSFTLDTSIVGSPNGGNSLRYEGDGVLLGGAE